MVLRRVGLLSVVVFLSACSLFQRTNTTESKHVENLPHASEQTGAPEHWANHQQHWLREEPRVPSAQASASNEVKSLEIRSQTSTTQAVHKVKHSTVPAEKALGWLKNGNTRYLHRKLRNDGKSQADRERLTKDHTPHTIVLSCSDSRVPPELIFDQALGEIYTIRVAGEALDTSVIASIEYAATQLGTNLILVMGHTQCGAIDASLKAQKGQSLGSPSLDAVVADIQPRLKSSRTPASSDLYTEGFVNAKGVAEDLVKRSSIIRELVNRGELKIQSSIYNLKTGKVDFE